MIDKHFRNVAAIIHLATFSKYFIPFGNFILPLVLWVSNRNKEEFIDFNGKQAINFQISILLYGIILGLIAIPLAISGLIDVPHFWNLAAHNRHEFDWDISDFHFLSGPFFILLIIGLIALGLLVLDVYCTIRATMQTQEGHRFSYPITIPFFR